MTSTRIAMILAACGCAAAAANAQPFLVNGSGATLPESFSRAAASTNDFLDLDGDGVAGSLGSLFIDQLAPNGVSNINPPFTNTFFIYHYRILGSGNGIRELDTRGTVFSSSVADIGITGSSVWNRLNLISAGVLQPLGNSSNAAGAPYMTFTSGPNAYRIDSSGGGGIQIDIASSDVPVAWFQTIAGTPGPVRVPGAAGYGRNDRTATNKDGSATTQNNVLRDLLVTNTNVSSPDANTVYDTIIALVPVSAYVNYGVGLSEIEMSDLRTLFGTGRRLVGENLMVVTRDSGSGTRNAFANGIAIDPSWSVGENVGTRQSTSNFDALGPDFLPSNKQESSGVDRTTRNHRLGVGMSGSERFFNSTLGNGQVDMLGVRADVKGGTVFARPTIENILDGSVNGYNIIGPYSLATIGNPRSAPASFGGYGWDPADLLGPAPSGPAPRNPAAAGYLNNITRSVAAFIAVPGGSDTEFMPGEYLAQNFLLDAAPNFTPAINPNPAAGFIPPVPNPNLNPNVQDFAANDPLQLFARPEFDAFNANGVGRIPARLTLTAGTYTDGSTGAYVDQIGTTYAANGSVVMPARNKIAGDFNGDGVRSVADATGLVAAWRQRNGGPAWVAPSGIYGAGAGNTAIIEVLGDFDGDGNFNAADVRYWADGLVLVNNGLDVLPQTPTSVGDGVSEATLDRAAGFTAVDNAFGGNFFGTTLATGTYNAGDSRGDVFGPGAATTRGFAPIGHDGVVDAFDIDYVCANFGDFTVLADAVNMDLSCDMNGDLLVDRADIEAIVEGILDSAFGDVNLDGVLDGADQAIITANLNTAGGWARGDLNCDGQITQADFCAVADLNGDGLADFGDVGIFVNAFTTGGSEADLNADGLNDFGDVGIFVSWFSACN